VKGKGENRPVTPSSVLQEKEEEKKNRFNYVSIGSRNSHGKKKGRKGGRLAPQFPLFITAHRYISEKRWGGEKKKGRGGAREKIINGLVYFGEIFGGNREKRREGT